MANDPVVFISYAHADDSYDEGLITFFAERLEKAIKTFTGVSGTEVFFDRRSIEWGDRWRSSILEGLESSTFFILFMSPNYFASAECIDELEEFLSLGNREKFLLPISYIEMVNENSWVEKLAEYQHENWQEIRTAGRKSKKVLKEIEKLAKRIRDVLSESSKKSDKPGSGLAKAVSRDYRANASWNKDDGDSWMDYYMESNLAFENEEYALARALILDSLDRFSEEPDLILLLAVVDWYDGALSDSIAEFEMALNLGVDRIEILQGLGQARVEFGDYERGIKELTEVIQLAENAESREYARSTRALGLGALGRYEEALKELATAEAVTPENAWLHFNRALILDWQGLPEAGESYKKALILNAPPLNRLKRQHAQSRILEMGTGL